MRSPRISRRRAARAEGFREGQERMRERAAQLGDCDAGCWGDEIRALPNELLPEDER